MFALPRFPRILVFWPVRMGFECLTGRQPSLKVKLWHCFYSFKNLIQKIRHFCKKALAAFDQ